VGFGEIGETVKATVEYYREDGNWHLQLHGPDWLIRDLYNDCNQKGGVFTIGNRGGNTMLIIAASWEVRRRAWEQPQDEAASEGQSCESPS